MPQRGEQREIGMYSGESNKCQIEDLPGKPRRTACTGAGGALGAGLSTSPRRQLLSESTARYCGSHQRFPKDPRQFLHNKGFFNIKLKVSTTYCENKFIVWPEIGHYLSLQRAPS